MRAAEIAGLALLRTRGGISASTDVLARPFLLFSAHAEVFLSHENLSAVERTLLRTRGGISIGPA